MVRALLHPAHRPVHPRREPGIEPRRAIVVARGGRDSEGAEAQHARFCLQIGRECP
jgi:hypothetical protein